jgi:glycosyltransferase involved in cell wall biosynthesis
MKEKKDNILFLEYFPFLGGGQRITLKIIEYLKKFYNIKFISFNDGLIVKELRKLKIKCEIMQAPKNAKIRYLWHSIPFYFKFKKYLKYNNIKLIYCNSYFTAKLATFVVRATNIPIIWHKHIIIENRYNSYLAQHIRNTSKYVNKIICVSNAVLESMKRIGVDNRKLCVVYNGINTLIKKKEQGGIRKKYKLKNYFVAGTIGFFRRNKGFEFLIKAALIVKQKEKNIKFFIAGKSDGDLKYENELKSLVENFNLNDTVIFGGFIDRFKCVSDFDVFVLPSYAEPFGLVTIEAGLFEKPVIAFATGATPEIIKDGVNGFLVKEVSAEKLAEKILYVYKNRRKIKRTGKTAYKIVKEKFDEKIMQKKIHNIIKEVLNEK